MAKKYQSFAFVDEKSKIKKVAVSFNYNASGMLMIDDGVHIRKGLLISEMEKKGFVVSVDEPDQLVFVGVLEGEETDESV